MDNKLGILLLDDEAEILNSLKRLLRKEYDVHIFTEGQAALDALAELDVAVIISDMRMPHMDGATFLAKAREINEQAIRILLTGYSDMDSTVKAVNEGGIFSYVNKPWNNDELKQLIGNAVRQYDLQLQVDALQDEVIEFNAKLQDANELLEQRVEERTEQLNKANQKLKNSVKRQRALFQSVIELINAVAQYKTGADSEHVKRVAAHSRLVAELASDDKHLATQVYLAALMHEVGKISLPDELLQLKDFQMDAQQRHQFHGHAMQGAKMLGTVAHLTKVAEIVAHIYEDFNGRGVPDRLADEQIPIGSRIIRVVNDYDKLITGRLNPQIMAPDLAMSYLTKYQHVIYDKAIVIKYQEVLKRLPKDNIHGFDFCCASKDLETGMILAQDVTYSNGTVMLTRETELSEVHILKIRQYERENEVNLIIFVH